MCARDQPSSSVMLCVYACAFIGVWRRLGSVEARESLLFAHASSSSSSAPPSAPLVAIPMDKALPGYLDVLWMGTRVEGSIARRPRTVHRERERGDRQTDRQTDNGRTTQPVLYTPYPSTYPSTRYCRETDRVLCWERLPRAIGPVCTLHTTRQNA